MTSTCFQFVWLLLSGFVNREQQNVIAYLMEENRVLRRSLGRKRIRFTDRDRRQLALKGKAIGCKVLNEVGSLVTPDTILRWYRTLIAKKYDGSKRRGPGRPRARVEIRELVIRMAWENSSWGYTRIQGALSNLGYTVGRTTMRRILAEAGIDPAPLRNRGMPWKTFIAAHLEGLAAMDFFVVEALTVVGLVRYHVLFVMHVATRRVQISGVVHEPCGAWTEQMARNLTDCENGFLRRATFLIHDRDPVFTERFRQILAAAGVRALRLPARSPNLNAYAERWVRSVRAECLSRMVILGERHLRQVLRAYVEHFHTERNHQGLGNRLIEPNNDNLCGPVACRKRLGGVLKHYHRRAA